MHKIILWFFLSSYIIICWTNERRTGANNNIATNVRHSLTFSQRNCHFFLRFFLWFVVCFCCCCWLSFVEQWTLFFQFPPSKPISQYPSYERLVVVWYRGDRGDRGWRALVAPERSLIRNDALFIFVYIQSVYMCIKRISSSYIYKLYSSFAYAYKLAGWLK